MSKKNEIYDVSAELAKEFGEIGTQSRERLLQRLGKNTMRRFYWMLVKTARLKKGR